jgi:signal transduction histidine kinase
MSVLTRSLDRLEKLVDDLLLLTSGEKELKMEDLDLGVLVTEVVEEYQNLAFKQDVNLTLIVECEAAYYGCTPLLARAAGNLIENGIRYNNPGGSVAVAIVKEMERVGIKVSDTGIGIPLDEQVNIFKRFYRVDRSRAQHKGGAGLGLSIIEHIVHLHGGSIEVNSLPGNGSDFIIWLPKSK